MMWELLIFHLYRISQPLFLFLFFLFGSSFSSARWWAEGGARREGLSVAQPPQHEALQRSEPLHPHSGQREGWARLSGTQRKHRSAGELYLRCHFHFSCYSIFHARLQKTSSSQTHQNQNTPHSPHTQTQTHPVTITAVATPFTQFFHNFTSSSSPPSSYTISW